ncbi:hypothetical protein [Methylobacter svalbardensis]|uniref:hypothetical protein n=1 Tax=Methylobacter svalbardensis TaxID=3080016 RepID=UPI0030EBAE4F
MQDQQQITSTKIADWANTKEAQAFLPRLIRRLIHATVAPESCDFPAGDSTSLPGWDGELLCSEESAWTPTGTSFWELSCEKQPKTKADRDYDKRTEQTDAIARSQTALVIVTARKWPGKKQWLKAKQLTGEWKEIRVFDAGDLEQWLEQCWPVALQFAEELGLNGPEVESVSRYWKTWSGQTAPAISTEAFFASREHSRDSLLANLTKSPAPEIYRIKADSAEEAVAFVCCVLSGQENLASASLVVTDAAGWRYAQMHSSINVAIAARPEVAERPALRSGLTIVVPYAAGDMSGYFQRNADGKNDVDLVVERPDIYLFEKALQTMGFNEGDAHRTSANTGRSWSIYRRQFAQNPAIRTPAWLTMPQAKALSVLCLLGAWSGNFAEDKNLVSALADCAYEDIEKDLRHLARQDDAPLLAIGDVWKAKSALELLALFGERISSDELNRFFDIAEQTLAQPDPILEMADEQRYAAQIYGKVRPQSGFLLDALCDTLIKLAVMATQLPGLQAARLDDRVAGLISRLLTNADGERWLSLSSCLPELAEAAPDAFLKAVERSLNQADLPVTRLITESRSTGIMGGRCWHSGLLWALETVAWDPKRFPRVALILARLVHVPYASNWGNTPMASLHGLFRSWLPQTAATIEQRIAALDLLIDKDQEVAFRLLDDLVHTGLSSATPAARPKWRDDDAGFGRDVTEDDYRQMVMAAADRMIALAESNPQRIVTLIEKLGVFDEQRVRQVLALIDPYLENSATDEDRESIRAALRVRIHQQLNYDQEHDTFTETELNAIEQTYRQLQPNDLLIRHRWLFKDGWLGDVPWKTHGNHDASLEQVEQLRIDSLQEIHATFGMQGIEQLADVCGSPYWLGTTLAKLEIPEDRLAAWLFENGGDSANSAPRTELIRGLLRALDISRALALLQNAIPMGIAAGWTPERIAGLWMLMPHCPVAWNEVSACGQAVESAYWSAVQPNFWARDASEDLDFMLGRLLGAGRPRTAFASCRYNLNNVEADILAEMLERFIAGEETDGPLLDSWAIGQALEALQASPLMDRQRLIRIEFALLPALRYGNEPQAKTLYDALMSEPALFNELLCMVYKPRHGERKIEPSESERALAETAWRVLRGCRLVPGTQADGSIDGVALAQFVDNARQLCREADRLEVCDSTLGQVLAYAPAGSDEIWPCEAVRELLDRPELEDMRRGVQIGIHNKRGVTSRACGEGGNQERRLADYYRQQAQALACSHVYVAEALEAMARSYEADGVRHDLDAQLSRERF